MQGIHRHYGSVSEEIAVGEDEPTTLPSRVHSIVLVSKLHRPTLQALAYARATRPSILEAVTVAVDPDEARTLAEEWERRKIPVPLKVLDSPFREITRPIVDYVRELRRDNPRDLVTVFVPEYVVGKWWEQLLHNQSALRLLARLRFTPGVVVTSVPYLLESGREAAARRRGRPGRRRRRHPGQPAAPCRDRCQRAGGRHRADRRRRRGGVQRRRADRHMTGPTTVELEVGPVAHGGHCVARHEGQVVFVRHALPGERVLAQVTDGGPGSRFLRADAVEVLVPSPHRVAAPCPHAHPGGCGGCDFQHAALPYQRELKAEVVREQMRRLAGLGGDPLVEDLVVEPVPGDTGGLGWRTRVRFAVRDDGRAGLRRHRSHDVEALEACPLLHPVAAGAGVLDRRWPGVAEVAVAGSVATGDTVVLVDGEASGRSRLAEEAGGRRWRVDGAGFWQVHPGAADALLDRGADRAGAARRGSTCSTCTPGWVCSPARWRPTWARPVGWTPWRRTRRPCARRAATCTTSRRVRLHQDRVERWLSGRAVAPVRPGRPGPAALGGRPPRRRGAGPARAARGGVRGLRPRLAGQGRGHARRAQGWTLDGPARVRPVPDDPPRRVRRARCSRARQDVLTSRYSGTR